MGIEGQLLAADVSVVCHDTKHVTYLIMAGAFLGLYIIGIPVVMFLMLWRNRKHLHMKKGEEEPTKEHLAIKAKLGGLYLQYEPKYWVSFFSCGEVVVCKIERCLIFLVLLHSLGLHATVV